MPPIWYSSKGLFNFVVNMFLLALISTCIRSLPVDAVVKWEEDKLQAAVRLAEFTYNNQKMERQKWHDVNEAFAAYGANWPCMFGEEATGVLSFFEKQWDKFKDGWKFTCGLKSIVPECLVYSLGSSGNMIFEQALLQDLPFCTIHIFDKDDFGLEEWFPDEAVRSRVHFHKYFISNQEDKKSNPPRVSLKTIMTELNHTHVDILKMDIEGAEWDILQGPLPSIGQMQVELHIDRRGLKIDVQVRMVASMFENVEKHGLRMFHKEVNARYDTSCIEIAFIQQHWRPFVKDYKLPVEAQLQRFQQQQQQQQPQQQQQQQQPITRPHVRTHTHTHSKHLMNGGNAKDAHTHTHTNSHHLRRKEGASEGGASGAAHRATAPE